MPDNTLSTLTQIVTKIRRLSRSPSPSQLSDLTIAEYVNNFILYDFPEHLRQFSLRTTLTFYTQPYIDTYSTTVASVDDPLYNFKNKYITTHAPVYIAGYPVLFTQDRSQFYANYPITNSIALIGQGNGVVTAFTGTLNNTPILRNNVLFSSVDLNNNALALKDDGNGNLVIPNSTPTAPASTINYLTGAYVVNFPTAPKSGIAINAMTVPYVAARPNVLLFYDSEFKVRPVPDQPYPINLEVYRRPTELLNGGDMPELSEWWQYIAYGATKKIFEDRMDNESVNLIMPEFKKQETIIARRSIVQYSNDRVATIYTDNSVGTGGNNFGGANF